MIIISNDSFDISALINEYPENSMERQLLDKISASNEKYPYDNLEQLKFELNLRKEIVNSAINLNNSGLGFSDFKNSKCNVKYWIRTENGGFLLNENAKPSEAINNIFTDGEKYATECATAIMIIYYKALLNLYGNELFDQVFSKVYLMDWHIMEPLLEEVGKIVVVKDILLGDRGYFKNPDFNPEHPEWIGENVIVLPNSLYYGHGIGIATGNRIINSLNSQRVVNATQSAYFLNSVGRPNFMKLFHHYKSVSSHHETFVWQLFPTPIA